ncbi:MAG: hypothetical protein HYR60_15460 [Acidobacteria bacterium]|nr:hypothetical protein [Acidobacteriota bacterium]
MGTTYPAQSRSRHLLAHQQVLIDRRGVGLGQPVQGVGFEVVVGGVAARPLWMPRSSIGHGAAVGVAFLVPYGQALPGAGWAPCAVLSRHVLA